MMRVEVLMDEPFRGLIAKVAREEGVTMPRAYRILLEEGLESRDYELGEDYSIQAKNEPSD